MWKLDYQPHTISERRSTIGTLVIALSLLVVAGSHVVSIMLLYRTGRSDMVRFAVPTGSAGCLYVLALQSARRRDPRLTMGSTVVIAFGLTLASFFLAMLITVNTFGT